MFVVAHFHMVMAVAPILVVFGAIYHWYPKVTGRMLDDTLGKIHFWVTFLGTYAIYYPMHYLGFMGVPRRYFAIGGTDFIPDSAHSLNAAITIAALVVGGFQLRVPVQPGLELLQGANRPAATPGTRRRWSGRRPDTPPKHGNFGKTLPVVYRWAYDYGVPGAKEDFIPQNVPPERAPAAAQVQGAGVRGSRREPVDHVTVLSVMMAVIVWWLLPQTINVQPWLAQGVEDAHRAG